MKGFSSSRELLFFSILCLLWLPNYCDISENEAGTKTSHAEPSHPSSPYDVSTQQEKETSQTVKSPVQTIHASVEYVNNAKSEDITRDTDVNKTKSSEARSFPDKFIQGIVNLEKTVSLTDNKSDVDERLASKHKISPELPELSKESSSPVAEKTEPIPPPVFQQHKPAADIIPQATPVMQEAVSILESAAPNYDGMPSFDEWKRMMLAQQQSGGSGSTAPTPAGKKLGGRRRNYSSYECGAKIVAANTEAEGASRVLNELVDEYMLNPCTAKIWFVIELCETVQATQIELANFELFSSCPKGLSVSSSDHFPTRDWLPLGTFTAAEQRVLQGFPLKQEGFGKFVKIELDGHYGKEHYCPLSVVRIFGTSMVDEYEEMETLSNTPIVADDELDRLDLPVDDKKDKKTSNIFGSATDAVINIVKKAAQALGQQKALEDGEINETLQEQQNNSEGKLCRISDDNSSSEKCLSPLNDDPKNTHQCFRDHLWPVPSNIDLIRQCDCVAQHLRYYSSAQQHCRFFQAVFGPVAFKACCDWLREHPMPLTSPIDKMPVPMVSDRSPPPQFVVVTENDTLVPDNLKETNISQEASTHDINYQIVTETVVLEPSIAQMSSGGTSIVSQNRTVEENSLSDTETTPLPTHTTPIDAPVTTAIEETTDQMLISKTPTVEGDSEPTLDMLTTEEEQELMSVSEDMVSDVPSKLEDIVTDVPSRSDDSITHIPSKPDDLVTDVPLKFGDMATDSPPLSTDIPAMDASLGRPETITGPAGGGQKESVFMRMSNRIKALEINMSLSGQYLQELSQRYRRQMEDMQRAFNRTIGTLNDTARKAAEKDVKQQEILNSLQLQVSNLTQTVELLVNERSSVFRQMIETHICLMVAEAIIMVTIVSLCIRRLTSQTATPVTTNQVPDMSVRLSKRRSSIDSSCGLPPPAKKVQRRSSSEEALHKGEKLLIIEPVPVLLDPISKVKKKNKRRNRGVQRSNSNPIPLRKNSQSTNQKSSFHSEGSIMKNKRSKTIPNCDRENWNSQTCSVVGKVAFAKERRTNGIPLHNLTNGGAVRSLESPKSLTNRSSRFSFRKFLRFQKRDSI